MLCKCSDPGCPCKGKCQQPSATELYRVDMDDTTGTVMCESCADDAMRSGLFTDCTSDDDVCYHVGCWGDLVERGRYE
jgi:hypothetical protein